MHFRSHEKIKESPTLDLDAGLILKILTACAVVGMGIFYLGSNYGSNMLFGKTVSDNQAADSRCLDQLLSRAKTVGQIADDELEKKAAFTFPSMLEQRKDRFPREDLLFDSLQQLLDITLKGHRLNVELFTVVTQVNKFGREIDDEVTQVLTRAEQELHIKYEVAYTKPVGGSVYLKKVEMAAPELMTEEEQLALNAAQPEPEVVIQDAKAKKSSPTEGPELGKFTVQIQSFQNLAEAETFKGLMEERGYHPFIQKADLGDMGIWYRVRMGRFTEINAAHKFKKRFEKSEGIATRVMPIRTAEL